MKNINNKFYVIGVLALVLQGTNAMAARRLRPTELSSKPVRSILKEPKSPASTLDSTGSSSSKSTRFSNNSVCSHCSFVGPEEQFLKNTDRRELGSPPDAKTHVRVGTLQSTGQVVEHRLGTDVARMKDGRAERGPVSLLGKLSKRDDSKIIKVGQLSSSRVVAKNPAKLKAVNQVWSVENPTRH